MVKQVFKDPLSFIGLLVILFFSILAIGGAYLRPDGSLHANDQHLVLARSAPGTAVDFYTVRTSEQTGSGLMGGILFGYTEQPSERIPYDSLKVSQESVAFFYKGDKLYEMECKESGSACLDYVVEHTENQLFLLGTDSFGRDMMSRLMAGSLVSLSVGFISVLISLLIGIGLGAIAGYFRGWVDSLVMWFINVIWSIPTLLMVIAITLVMGKGFVQVFIAVGLTMWVEVARIVRGQFLAIREQGYLQAGRAMGYSHSRLIFKHMLPNAMGPVIVISAANFASAILIEAGLSFLGIGTQIPMPSWGGMIKEHYAYITTDMAYLAILPGICITLLVLSLMLIGNRLRDVLDVKRV